MYETSLKPLHNYLLHLLTSRTPPVLQKNMRCAEYSSGDGRGPTLMGTPRHCTNHAFRAVRQWGGRGPTLMSTPRHCKKTVRFVRYGSGVGGSNPYEHPAALQKNRRFVRHGGGAGRGAALMGMPGAAKISRFAQHSDDGAHFGRRGPTL